ncbi:hypothetical protein JDV02_005214 [Purpureocillium takamizusanense]|uniref:Zn(2)-C6 fungal-type domain-containing protein n=1 Tax=Purpureocillium takamizusanense TaxID=2060973 RepID=A0A9Q8QHI5_9HYPO|nr:uncharacterized protein JDV02_005214 [Purpureocillium takamizusanense]UNI18989.1 hypothetical protein JDV02_005214 [Purpureocillium takamizusanense]
MALRPLPSATSPTRPPHQSPSPDASRATVPTTSTSPPSALGQAADGPSTQAPMKRNRRSNPKVKTGCANCKKRRIKCDERRPSCTQCERSNKLCTGYPPPSRSDRPFTDVRIAPKPLVTAQQLAGQAHASGISGIVFRTPTVLPPRRANRRKRPVIPMLQPAAIRSSLTVYQPSQGLHFVNTDALYFELFRVQTAAELSGYFNSNFWTQHVLQECHSENAIRHAVVALGALYKTLEQSSQPSPSAESAVAHWQVAVKQYSESCNAMLLLAGENARSYRTRLMASVLLACFDSFIGDHKQAIVQIQTGLNLLEQLRNHTRNQSPKPNDNIEEEDLVVIFTRMAIQAKSYDMAFHFPQPYVIRLTPHSPSTSVSPESWATSSPGSSPVPSLPARFESVLEAKLASDRICEKLIRFIERLHIAKPSPSRVLPASWKQYGLQFRGQLDAWSEAFEPILRSRHDPGLDQLERSAISALKMFQINTNILFMMMFCDTEVHFDGFTPHFKAIVDLGWEVVDADEKRAAVQRCSNPGLCHCHHNQTKGDFRLGKLSSRHIKPSFSADMGIVPPLFVVATKCREPRVRRQAILLLRSSARREGMWDSELAANIGQWVMEVEEFDEMMPPGTMPTRPIPEEKRVMVKTVDFDLRARFADLRVGTRALYDGCPDDRSRKTRITW